MFNPLRERALERFAAPQDPVEMATLSSTRIASTYFQPRVGGDAAALKGIMKALLEMDEAVGPAACVLDHDFIATHTEGFGVLKADLEQTLWADIERESGLDETSLRTVADAYARSNATIITYGMGMTQHATGTQNVHQMANLLLLRGNFGKPGAGICPLRGHSNVPGDRTVGITEKPGADMLERIEKTYGFRPPSAHGHDAVQAFESIAAGRSRALLCLGGNLAVAMPDASACFPAMNGLELSLHIATKFNRTHLLTGKNKFILPCLGRTERDLQASGLQAVTVEDSMSMVHASSGKLPPASPALRSEPAIIAGMAAATMPESRVPWMELIMDYDRIRDGIESVFPDFANFNERIRVPGGFRLPLPPTERIWKTPTGKAQLIPFSGVTEDASLLGSPVLRLATIRSHDQYNTTIYGFDDRYRGVFGRRDVVFMNAEDIAELGMEEGDRLVVETAYGRGKERVLSDVIAVVYDISKGSVAAYYPEANDLVALDHIDPASGTPSYKSVPVRIRRAGPALAGEPG